MKKYLIVLILLATASVSNGQSAVANQEKYKIVASAAAYNQSYPYFGVLNFSLTDLGSSIARVILPSQDHKFVKIDASGQIQNLTTSSSNSNADGHTIVVEGIAMSQNEQFYYYYYADYITINNSWILAQLSINNGILATSYIYAASANQNLYNTIATNNKGTVATVVENFDPITKQPLSFNVIRISSIGQITILETLAAEKFSYGTIKINDEDTVFVQSWKAPLALYAFTNAGVKIEIDRGATYNSDAPMQTSSKTATHPEGTVYYLKDNRIMDSDHSVIFDPSDNGENLYISSFFVSPDQHVFTISYSASLNKYFLKEDGNILLSTGQNLLEVYNISYIEGLRGNGSGEISFVIRDSSPQGVYHLIKYTDDSDPEFLIHITALNLSVSTPNYCDIVGPPDATRCQIVGIKNQSSLSIPFGAHLSLELRDKLGTIIPASFSLVPKTFVLPDISVSSANPTGKIQLEGNSLYPNRIALLFGQDSGKMKQNLITVHMGTQQLMVSPEGKNSISISLISVPARIGNDNNSFDSVIRGRAHKTGFPPQYIKAQIRKEAAGNAFNPNSYRYEPDYDRVRQTPDSLNEIAYARYVFSSAGRAPSNEQVHPRSLYKLYPGLEENRITDNYEYTFNPYKAIKANNIVYEFSNSSQNWYLPKVLSNGTTIPVDYDALEVKLDFVAQTVTASSYGLLQVMYRTAVEARDYFDYQTIDGENFYKRGKDPIALFQPELNLKVGVGYLVKSYRTMNALYQKNISVVNEIETYNDYMSNAFAGYNGSFTKESAEKNKRVLDYKKDVISILPRYLIKF